MDHLYYNITCHTTKIYIDSLTEFSNGYSDAADLIISTLFASHGLYDIVSHTATEESMIKYGDARFNLQASYIWRDLFEVSDLLRCSYLYKTTHNSLPYIMSFNDTAFNKTIKNYKEDLIDYVQKHSMFLAYCDIEKSGLFLYTNPEQALPKNKFITLYDAALKDSNTLYKKYQGKVPRIILSILQEIKEIIDVRETNEEMLVLPLYERTFVRCLPTFNKNIFNDIIFNFSRCQLNELHRYMEMLYTNFSLLHVISCLDWLLYMQGRTNCMHCQTSLQDFMTLERLEYLMFIQETIQSRDTSFIKQELSRLHFLKKAFRGLRSKNLLQHYSLISLGFNASFIIANATRLYNDNIKLITYADLLFAGFYDVIDTKYLPSYEYINCIIIKAEKDFKDLMMNNTVSVFERKILNRATYSFCQSLKKMKRFCRWLKGIQYDDLQQEQEIQEGIDIIFGDVVDNDGQPSICPICLDSSSERKDTWWRIDPCSHRIHLDCYNELCENEHCVCPMCRVKIT